MVYLDFFMTPEEVIEDLYKNSIIKWTFKKSQEKFIIDGK